MGTSASLVLTPDLLLRAYAHGLFPMAEHEGPVHWHDPDPRAVFPLETTRPNARLVSYLRSHGYTFTLDRCFERVMRACADRTDTWISADMIDAYTALHRAGHAHSAEAWKGDELIGGIYGVSIGAAFFGESMFSRATNASKGAFHHLAAHLRECGFLLFDTQYLNDHTRSLGAVEIKRLRFRRTLARALRTEVRF